MRSGKSSRVSPDGRTVMFASAASLTGYDNQTDCQVAQGPFGEPIPCYEIYLYSAETGRLVCVSCNPRASDATSPAYLYLQAGAENEAVALTPQSVPRNLSDDGNRVFFETEEALVPQDTNGAMNVYEWEREGAGSCPAGRGGCLYLISSGQSSEPSYFAEASSSGDDVFFLTRQQLVGQDTDELVDVYDARVGGGIAAQNPPPAAAPCLGEEACRGAQGPAQALGVPTSQAFSGPGNLAPQAEPNVVATLKPKPSSTTRSLTRRRSSQTR